MKVTPAPTAAAKRRKQANSAERKTLATYKAAVADAELAHGGRDCAATGQTIAKARLNEPPLTRLKRLGRLDVHELTAADDILFAYHLAAGVRVTHDSDLGVRGGDPKPDAAHSIAATRIDVLEKYRQWRTDLAGHPALAAAVGMLLDERPARSVERAQRWRNGQATKHLVEALRHFAALRGNTPRGSRGWKLPPQSDALDQAKRLARLAR